MSKALFTAERGTGAKRVNRLERALRKLIKAGKGMKKESHWVIR
jgi:hypothetical protein